MTPHALAGSPPATSQVVTTTRFGRLRRPAWPAAPPRTRLTPINPLGLRLGPGAAPQRRLELEVRVGIVERVAEQLADPREAVADRLRMQVQRPRRRRRVSPVAEVGERGLLEALAAARGELVESGESPGGDPVDQRPALEQHQLGEVVVGADQTPVADRARLGGANRLARQPPGGRPGGPSAALAMPTARARAELRPGPWGSARTTHPRSSTVASSASSPSRAARRPSSVSAQASAAAERGNDQDAAVAATSTSP